MKYAVVAVDYFTKWVEPELLATITTKKLVDFVYRSIMCHFGIPYKLISDNGKQFDSKDMRELCDNLGILKGSSAVSHPLDKWTDIGCQENHQAYIEGQIE